MDVVRLSAVAASSDVGKTGSEQCHRGTACASKSLKLEDLLSPHGIS